MTSLGHSKRPAPNSPRSAAWIPLEIVSRQFPRVKVSKVSLERGASIDIYFPGRNLRLRGVIASYEQSATQTIRQPALTATGGRALWLRVCARDNLVMTICATVRRR